MGSIAKRDIKRLASANRHDMEKAFNHIYQEYVFLLYYIALKITSNSELSKDICQQVFLKLYENRGQIKTIKNLKAYLTTMCRNTAINSLQKENKYVSLEEEVIDEHNINNDFELYIAKFKDFLQEDEIDLVIYRFLYDFSFNEIAELHHCSINVITGKYRRTMIKIRKHYQEKRGDLK